MRKVLQSNTISHLALLQKHQKEITYSAKKKSCTPLNGWIKSVINHLWWAVSTCGGDETLLREKWCSILLHIQNKHKWTSCSKFYKCVHPKITKSKAKKLWLKPISDAFKALQYIVLNKNLLKDLKCLTKFSHTGILEIFHVSYNKWIPKSQHFSYLGMITRSQLAKMDFNSGRELPQAKKRMAKRGII